MFPENPMSCESALGSSPPCRPCIAECSDLFKAVMEDISSDDNLLSRAVVDTAMSKSSADTDLCDMRNLCKRCLRDRALCRCFQRRGREYIHRVSWVDELYDKPLAISQTVTDIDNGSISPRSDKQQSVKPILKHKANCIIIVSE